MAATKVLVVDDDLNIQRVLVFTLKQEGFEVIVASDGQTGVQMAKDSQPDLILMDVAMPKLDGYAATQQIRAAEEADGGCRSSCSPPRRTSASGSRACAQARTTTSSSPSTRSS